MSLKQAVLPVGFDARDAHLTLDGHDLAELGQRYGTPLFVFSERQLRHNASSFLAGARAGHERARVFYASKACSNRRVLEIFHEEGLDIEVNSGGELYKAQRAGYAPRQIVFNGVAKSVAEIDQAIALDIQAINVDAVFELRRIGERARAAGSKARVSLRLVPGIAGGATPGIQTGSASSKFGMTQDEFAEALAWLKTAADVVEVVGIHLHIGSQVDDTDAYLRSVSFAAEQGKRVQQELGTVLSHVNLGGGYPIDYSHQPTGSNELGQYAAARKAEAMVGDVAGAARKLIGTEVELLFEPGRAMVGNTAVLLTTVESCRQRGGHPWIYLNAGYNLMIDAAAVRWYYHMVNASRAGGASAGEMADFRVVGPLCDSADCFFDVEGEYLFKKVLSRLPDLTPAQREELRSDIIRLPATRRLPAATIPGDTVALLDVGAYTLEEMFQYCGRQRAAAVMLTVEGEIAPMLARDENADLVSQER
jgi:diaminopimelate decarboxylase